MAALGHDLRISTLTRAYAAGEAAHKLTEPKAQTTLLKIAVHASYHMGQLNLLRRLKN